MKRNLMIGAAAALLTVGGAGIANAQDTNKPVGVSLRVGLFFPTSSDISDRGNSWLAFGAQYKLFKVDSPDVPGHIALSVDYFSRNDVSETPILLNYVAHQGQVFGSVGAGIAFDRADGDGTTRFAYQVGVGYNFDTSSLPLFLEAKFWGSDESRFDGFGVYAGVRF